MRVLKWIIERCEGKGGAVIRRSAACRATKTSNGGLASVNREAYAKLSAIDAGRGATSSKDHAELFDKLKSRCRRNGEATRGAGAGAVGLWHLKKNGERIGSPFF